jgi:hypothetical protein
MFGDFAKNMKPPNHSFKAPADISPAFYKKYAQAAIYIRPKCISLEDHFIWA